MKNKLFILSFLFLFLRSFYPAVANCTNPPDKQHFQIFSESLNKNIDFSVYVPPCYDKRLVKGYPVLYLLHGQNMDESVWDNLHLSEDLQAGWKDLTLPYFLVITIREEENLQDLFYSDFDRAILESVIPWVDQTYHTCIDPSCRAIAGMSRGALWAADIAFNHPDIFGSVGLLSLPGSPFDDQTVHVLITQMKQKNGSLRILIDSGSEDAYRMKSETFCNQLTFEGFPYSAEIHFGGHDNGFWQSRLPYLLSWVSLIWTRN